VLAFGVVDTFGQDKSCAPGYLLFVWLLRLGWINSASLGICDGDWVGGGGVVVVFIYSFKKTTKHLVK